MRPGVSETERILSDARVSATDVAEATLGVIVRVASSDAVRALDAFKADGYDMLADLLGADIDEQIEITYHLRDLRDHREVYVKARTAYDGAFPSVWRVYPAALFAEREAGEMFGVSFSDHPNPARLLTTDEIDVPLLRKSTAIRTEEEVTLLDRE